MVGVALSTSFSIWCSSSPSLSPWECSHCTTVNEMRAVLCTTCERPRLATAASLLQDSLTSLPSSPNSGESRVFVATTQTDVQAVGSEDVESKFFFFSSAEWQCKSCTVLNSGSSILCEVCERPRLATRPPVMPSPGSQSADSSRQVCLIAAPCWSPPFGLIVFDEVFLLRSGYVGSAPSSTPSPPPPARCATWCAKTRVGILSPTCPNSPLSLPKSQSSRGPDPNRDSGSTWN